MARGNGNGPTIQEVIIELRARGLDVMSVLAHAIQEARGNIVNFNRDAGDTGGPSAQIAFLEKWTARLRSLVEMQEQATRANRAVAGVAAGSDVQKGAWETLIASGLKLQDTIRQVGEAEVVAAEKAARAADALADRQTRAADRAADAQVRDAERAEAATERFIEQANAALGRKEAEEARLDAQAKARLDARAARDQKALEAIGEAAEKEARAAEKEARALTAAQEKGGAAVLKRVFDEDRRARAVEAATQRIIAANEKVTTERIDRELAEEERRLMALAAAADKAHDAFLATVVPLNSLTDSAMRFKSTQIDATLRADAEAMRTFSLRADAVARNLGGYANASDAAADRSKKMGQFAMNASYAFQDMQYGLGAFVNNVGLLGMSADRAFPKLAAITASMGGTAGLAAGAMAAGVALDLLWQNIDKSAFTWENFDKVLGTGVPLRTTTDLVAQLKEKLQELTGKTWKTAVDTEDIRYLEDTVRRLTEERQAYDRLVTGRTKVQQERSRVVEEAVVESGAGDDFETGGQKIVNTLEKTLPLEQTAEARDLRKQIAELKKEMKGDLQGSFRQLMHVAQLRNLEADLSDFARDEWVARRQKAEDMLAGASRTRQGAAALDTAVGRNEEAFRKQGIDVDVLREGLRRADDPIRAKEQEEWDKEHAKNREAAQKAKIKADEDAAKQADAEMEAEINLNLATGDEMKRQRVEGQQDARRKKQASDRAKAQGKRDESEATRERNERIQQAGQAGKGMIDTAEAIIDRNRLAQKTGDPSVREADLRRHLETVIAAALKQVGKDPTLSTEIVARAFEDATNKYAGALAITGNSIQALMQINTEAMARLQSQEAALFRQWQAINQSRTQQRRRNPNPRIPR